MDMKRYLISAAAAAMSAMMFSTAVWADASQSKYFTDMNDQSYGFWAIDEVDSLCSKGVVKGVGDNKFAPENLMERGDFILMLDNAFNFPAIESRIYQFYDVSEDAYYYTAILNARGNGIIDDEATVRPENAIRRIDAFKMLYNTMNMYGCVGSNGSTDLSMYSDASLVVNAKEQIAAGTLTKLGIISGSNGELKPNDTVTRAEMAVMLSKAIEVYEANGSKEADTGSKQTQKPILSGVEANPDPDRVVSTEEKITETFVVENGESETIDGNEVSVSSGDGVIARGTNTKLTIDGSKLTTASKGSKVVSVLDGAEAELTGVDINASANESIGVYVDEDSEAEIESSKIFARYTDGVAVESAGNTKITDSTVQSVKAEAVKVHTGSAINITDTDIVFEGTNSGIAVRNTDQNYDTTTINLTGVEFKGNSKGTAILVENSKTIINFKDVTLNGVKTILDTSYKYSKGIKNTEVELNLDGQKLEGNINADDMAIVTLSLTNGSTFKGSLNYSDTAKEMNIRISADSLLELTDDCYIDSFIVEDERMRSDRNFDQIIDDNGSTIYYDANNHDNDYLNEGTYTLPNGGRLTPYYN
jgi:hypothetical protein